MMKPSYFSILLAILISRICTFSTATTDQDALHAFKSSITSDPYQILKQNWTNHAPVCSWIGVACSAVDQRVTALNISGFAFAGPIVPNIGNLTFLEVLVLNTNNFTGLIPQELSNLHHLRVLDFGSNNLSGEVPSWLGSLNELESVRLNRNALSGSIPRSLGNNTKLRILNLAYNFLGGVIPIEITNISSLQALDLKYNNQIEDSIPRGVFDLSRIEIIDLTGNSLSGELPNNICQNVPYLRGLYLSANLLSGRIPFEIHNCSELQDLSLSFNHFNGSIPSSIGLLSQLRTLFLGINTFHGVIPPNIHNLTRLELLSLQGASLTGQIPSYIFNMSSLESVDLSNNTLSGGLPLSICDAKTRLEQLFLDSNQLIGRLSDRLCNCRSLSLISLSKNNFTDNIPRCLANLTALNYVYLDSNTFTGEIPPDLGNLNLIQLILHTNLLSGAIPSSIFNISSIQRIQLSFNNLSGKLPSTLGLWLPNLQQLSMTRNNLNCPIPTSIANASSLTLINLGYNSFNGPMPHLGSLQFLQRIFIGQNNLTGESPDQELGFLNSLTSCRLLAEIQMSLNPFQGKLPPSIGNFSDALEIFSAFGCGIRGSIPAGIANLSSLHDLYLDMNELTVSIPDSVGELSQLIRVYLEYNMLEGVIPSGLCKLARLGDFYVSGNRLRGPIPSCIGEMKSFKRLYLDSNMLESSVPSGLWNLTDLLELNLSTNFLSGSLESGVGDLNGIGLLDLSWNQFSGDVLDSIGSVGSLVDLSLAHNEFEGSIPQSLGNIKGLESLDLSYNKLYGQIPNSLETLRFLTNFNVSYNKLEGSIPSGGNFVNFTFQSFVNNSRLCGAPRLQVPPCKGSKNKARSKNVIIYILTPCLFVLLGVVSLTFLFLKRRKSVKHVGDIEASLLPSWRGSTYLELQRATNAFSEGNLLGNGSFGSVYAGKLSDDLTVAVKVFDLQSQDLAKSFDTETQVLREIRHRNLVKIIGCCSNLDFKALIYEYMPNGSLEKWLYSHNHFLDLLQRLNIAIDVSSALEYLHHGLTNPVVHRDLKPSNILLDEDMTAYVGDFGIAKIFEEGALVIQTETLATVGYMSPEYGAQGVVSTSADVYSFGVVMLELFTRKKPTDEMFSEEMSLVKWVSLSLHEGSAMTNYADANLLLEEDRDFSKKEECLFSVLCLAMDCLADSPSERIKMSEAVANLEKIKTIFLANRNN